MRKQTGELRESVRRHWRGWVILLALVAAAGGILALLSWLGDDSESTLDTRPLPASREEGNGEGQSAARVSSTPFRTEPRSTAGRESSPVESILRLRVRDETDHPVGGAGVHLSDGTHLLTDEKGEVDCSLAAPTLVDVSVSSKSHYPLTVKDVPVIHGLTELPIYLMRTSLLLVTVRHEGLPVAGARVDLSPVPFYVIPSLKPEVAPHLRTRFTNEDGVASFPDLGIGGYHVTASCDGLIHEPPYSSIRVTDPGSQLNLLIDMEEGERVLVRVVDDESGKPVAGAATEVSLAPFGRPRALPEMTSDKEGQLGFTRPKGVGCMVRILRHEGYLPGETEIHAGITAAVLSLVPTPLKIVKVRTPTGEYLTHGMIEVRNANGNISRRAITAKGTEFVLGGLIVSQSHQFRFHSGRNRTPWSVLGRDSNLLELVLSEPAVVCGRITFAGNESAVAGCQVAAWRVISPGGGQAGHPFSFVEDSAVTDTRGQFELSLYSGSLYRVRSYVAEATTEDVLIQVDSPDGMRPGASALDPSVMLVRPGARRDLGEIRAHEGGSVEVLVTRNNSPVAFSRVWLIPHNSLSPRSRRQILRTDPHGRAVFRHVLPGNYYCAPTLPSVHGHGPSLLFQQDSSMVKVRSREASSIVIPLR